MIVSKDGACTLDRGAVGLQARPAVSSATWGKMEDTTQSQERASSRGWLASCVQVVWWTQQV